MDNVNGRSVFLSSRFLYCLAMVLVVALGFVGLAMADDDELAVGTVKVRPGSVAIQPPSPGLTQPVNDVCSGALTINDGPYPVLSPTTTDMLDATDDGSDPQGSCAPGEHLIWYKWTPAATAFYKFQTCAASAGGPTASNDGDGVMAVFTSGGGCAGPFTEVGCNDDGCHAIGPSIVNFVQLTGGVTYYILVGHYVEVGFDMTQAQVQISTATAPTNDTCATPKDLFVNTPITDEGTLAAADDYQVAAACYTAGGAVGSVSSTATAGDVAYRFTAPSADRYSFRVFHYCGGPDPILYLLNTCGAPGAQGANCLRAANRGTASLAPPSCPPGRDAEEVKCFTMTAGQVVYPVVDATAASNVVTQYDIEVTRCVNEVEFNGAPASASPLSCGAEGSILSGGGLQDVDFWQLGTNTANARVYTMIDACQSNPGPGTVNYDMRITDATSTLEFDDLNNASFFGANSPNIAGTKLTNAPNFIRVTQSSTSLAAEPYRLYALVREPGTEVPETEPNDGAQVNPGDYFSGSVAGLNTDPGDIDFFGYCVKKGDEIMLNQDSDPTRNATPYRAGLFLFGPNGFQIPPGVADAATTSSTTAGPLLTSTTPFSPAQALVHRALVDGFYFYATDARIDTPPAGTGATGGDYLISASLNCQIPKADLSVTKTGPIGPVPVNSDVTYTITISNHGPNNAACTTLNDTVPDKTTFVGITVPDGWDCPVLPPVGGSGPIQCIHGFIDCTVAPDCLEGSAEFQVTIHVPYCYEHDLTNTATVSSFTTDADSSNNSATATNVVIDPRTCEDGSECTVGDFCVGNDCVSGPGPNCDDGNPCTDDGCDPGSGCTHDNNTAPCDDGNICTGAAGTGIDQCSGGACVAGGCNTNSCNDNNACTTNDTCSNCACVGGTPPNCNDGNECTNDSCDPLTGCQNVCNHTCDGNVKGYGWWKRLCRGPHPSGEFISQQDADCVNDTCTFGPAGPSGPVLTPADICNRLNPDPQNDKCEKAEAQFMTFMLNYCRCRTGHYQPISASCGPDTTVEQAKANADAALCNNARTNQDCILAHDCDLFPVTTGQALWANSVRLERLSGTSLRLTWSVPYTDGTVPNPTKYRIYARAASEDVFVMLAEVNGNQFSYQHNGATGPSYQYQIQGIW